MKIGSRQVEFLKKSLFFNIVLRIYLTFAQKLYRIKSRERQAHVNILNPQAKACASCLSPALQ
jgi:hypothetical protein